MTTSHMERRWVVRCWKADGSGTTLHFPAELKANARRNAIRLSRDPAYSRARVVDNYEELPDDPEYVSGYCSAIFPNRRAVTL